MARLILVACLIVAALLVAALVSDRRDRTRERAARLRRAFLHGAALGSQSRQAAIQEVVHEDLRFRVPSAWSVERSERGTRFQDSSPDACGASLEMQDLALPGVGGVDALAAALGSRRPEKERSLERLPNGAVLMKHFDLVGEGGAERVAFGWHLGRLRSRELARVAVFRLEAPHARTSDILVQSDVATWDREIRNAQFAEEPPGPA